MTPDPLAKGCCQMGQRVRRACSVVLSNGQDPVSQNSDWLEFD